jgi:hypothetical protein
MFCLVGMLILPQADLPNFGTVGWNRASIAGVQAKGSSSSADFAFRLISNQNIRWMQISSNFRKDSATERSAPITISPLRC